MQVAGEGQRRPFYRICLHLTRNDIGQRVADVVAWPRRMHPFGEPGPKHFSINADDVRPDTHMSNGLYGTEPVRDADTGVQRNCLPGGGNSVLLHPVVTQELCRGISAVDFESLVTVGVVGGTEVMQDAAQNTSSSS
jgi:hypothetical protein